MKHAAAILLSTLALSTYSQQAPDSKLTGKELYVWLEKKAMSDADVSNARIHELVVDGLFSDDQAIVDSTLAALALHTNYAADNVWIKGKPRLDRRLQDIPGIYDFLIELWKRNWRESDGVMPVVKYLSDDIRVQFETSEDPNEIRQFLNSVSFAPQPSWVVIPHILGNLFAKDPQVHDILWDALYDPQDKQRLLRALNAGEFDTQEARDYRIEVLSDKESEWYDARMAAIGLGRFQSDEGLKALVDRLKNPESKWGLPISEIVEAIVAHGEKALPHEDLLRRYANNPLSVATTREEKQRLELALKLLDHLVHHHRAREVDAKDTP